MGMPVFDDNRQSALIAEATQWVNVPRHHGSDPFTCPCCANVFERTLALAGVDLAQHAGAMSVAGSGVLGSLFLTNARIHTMNPQQPEADSMLVQDGRISWIGLADEAPEAAEEYQRVDARGQYVQPGFIDPHMHLAPLAMLLEFENLGPFRFDRTADALAHLATIAARTPEGEWLVGRQFDPSLQEGPAMLTADRLDEVSSVHPIFIYNASLHLAYCNSLALELAGVDADTPDPEGAEIGRFADGSPNGVLKAGPAMALVARYNPVLKQQNVGEACLGVLAHANSLGLTMICDQGTGLFQGARELDLYQGMRDSGRMTTRFRYSLSQSQAARWDELGVRWGEGDAWVRNSGWKIVSDGSNQGYTGLQRQPFLNTESRGIAYIEVDELNDAVMQRLAEGWAVCVHANGDAAIDRVLDAFEKAADQGLNPAQMRCRIEHCSILHDEQIERMAALGVSPSFLIGHVYYWGAAFVDDVFGPEKAAKLDRTGACEARGIRWTLHSDDPVTEMSPLRCIENAVTRSMWKSDERLSTQECISVDAALRAMTIDAAWQCHSDHEVGSLEVGKYADFVVLGQDPRTVPLDELARIPVLQTWVNGQQVFGNKNA